MNIYSSLEDMVGGLDRKTVLAAVAGGATVTLVGGALLSKFFWDMAAVILKRHKGSAAEDFCDRMSLRLNEQQKALRKQTEINPHSIMMSAASEAQLLGNFLRMLKAKNVIEVGVYTGYGTLTMAQALPEDGNIVACDVSEEYTSIGRPFWRQAGVEHKIDLRIAPAVETLQKLVDSGKAGTFDFAFIDADKSNYENYYELCLELIRPGGVIAVDNVFMFGTAFAPEAVPGAVRKQTEGIVILNEKIRTDDRVHISMINISDGLTIAVKK